MNRDDCTRLIADMGLPPVEKSACYFCPYHSDVYWHQLQVEHPDDFEKACDFDEEIRNMEGAGVREQVFLHHTLKPLRGMDFTKPGGQILMFDMFGNECEGHCGL